MTSSTYWQDSVQHNIAEIRNAYIATKWVPCAKDVTHWEAKAKREIIIPTCTSASCIPPCVKDCLPSDNTYNSKQTPGTVNACFFSPRFRRDGSPPMSAISLGQAQSIGPRPFASCCAHIMRMSSNTRLNAVPSLTGEEMQARKLHSARVGRAGFALVPEHWGRPEVGRPQEHLRSDGPGDSSIHRFCWNISLFCCQACLAAFGLST